ncbi:CPBP family intramembrane glutamic endopeptidase [Caldalkalibacillus mannanilyticus]|uniref:CPBP family intramembrane glutamic endopeptidase n=1 Tax=Caldalkalibacillus mannanilyticus TaxID=1418 RepID=UPI00046A28B8|nr:CPBP family intramembrane glutamic endopeptidase [Caldalkalibacillus mannanilyticus]
MRTGVIHWRLFGILFVMGMVGVVGIFPYSIELQKDVIQASPIELSTPMLFLINTIQGAIMLALLLFLGLWLARKTGLGAPYLEKLLNNEKMPGNFRKVAFLSIGLGILVGSVILVGDILFQTFGVVLDIEVSQPAWWKGLLASFYGGITEELQLRLFFMTLLVWIFSKLTRQEAKPIHLWLAIVLAALLFGLGHLPALMAMADLTITTGLIVRTIVLNMIGGVLFGWLYWKKGLESAMLAHFSADIILHVLFPLMMNL